MTFLLSMIRLKVIFIQLLVYFHKHLTKIITVQILKYMFDSSDEWNHKVWRKIWVNFEQYCILKKTVKQIWIYLKRHELPNLFILLQISRMLVRSWFRFPIQIKRLGLMDSNSWSSKFISCFEIWKEKKNANFSLFW